jgi:fibronectin-binding autotransporter adhesin
MRSERTTGVSVSGKNVSQTGWMASSISGARRRRGLLLNAIAAATAATAFISGPALVNATTVTFAGPSNPPGSTSFNTNLGWSDGNAPAPGNDYIVAGTTALLQIRTPASGGSITFLGNSLTLGAGTATTAGELTDKNIGAYNVTTINNLNLNFGTLQNGGDGGGLAWTDVFAGTGITIGAGGATFDTGGNTRSFVFLDSIGGASATANVSLITSGGSVQFFAANNYAGTTTLATGTTLLLGVTNAISGNGNITDSGTILANTTNAISGNGNITISGTFFANGNNAIAGTGNISLTGGSLVLNSSENFTGLISFGTGTGNLDFSKYNTTDYSNQIKNSTTSININTNGQFVNFAGSIDSSNTGGLTKNNGGTLSLSGTNAYTGATTIASGVLQVNSAGALGSGTGLISFTGGTLQYTSNNTTDYSNRFAVLATTGGNTYSIDTNGQTVSFASPLVVDTAGGSLTKLGAGTLNLSATSTYTGATTLFQGTLNLSANAGGNVIAAASALSLRGGMLQVTGDGVGGIDAQTVASTTIAGSDSNLSLVQNGAASVTLNMGSLIHVAGATVNFAQSSTAGVLQFNTATGAANSLINDAGVAYATVGGTDWAAKDLTNTYVVGGSTIAGFYTPDTSTTISGNADVGATDTTLAAPATPTSLRFNDGTGPRTLTLTGQTLSTGGILVTSNVGANLATITGGSLSSDSTTANKDLEIIQNNTAAGLTISSVITNNPNAGTPVVTGLTKSGPGLLTLGAANTYTGPTTVSQGTLSVPTGASITSSTANLITIGTAPGHNAVLSISGGSVAANDTAPGQFGGSLLIGSVLGSSADIQISSGSLSSAEQLNVGNGAGGYAGLTNNGGNITSGTYLVVGFTNDKASFTQTAGSTVVTADVMTIAGNPGAVGVANISGGTFTATGAGNDAGTIYVGENGQGTLNVSGTASVTLGTTNAAGLFLGRGQNAGAAAAGTVNLLGGTLSVPLVTRGAGSGFFNFNGGTLRAELAGKDGNTGATGTAQAAYFMNGLSGAYVYGGATGSTIDNNGFNIGIAQALMAPTGNGISSVPMGSLGSGYIDSPLVAITGGGGTGATAVANVNPATGQVTSVSITNPGVGYTSTPTITLSGGGGSGATIGTIGTTPNSTTGVGLNFKGAGTTTLFGVNTYTGNTNVNGGTLVVSNSASLAATGHLSISSGAALQGSGSVGLTSLLSGSILNVGNNNSSIGTLTAASLATTGGATPTTLNYWFGSSTSFDQVTVSGAGGLNLGGGTFDLFATGGTSPFSTPGTYNLINYNGGFTGSLSNLKIGDGQPGTSYVFGSTGSAITLTVTAVSSFIWDNHSNSDENYTNANNWQGNAAPPSAAGTSITFGTANTTGNGTVNLNSAETVGAIILDSGVGGSLSYNITPVSQSVDVLTLSNTGSPAGIAVNNGSHTIGANISLATPATLSGAASTNLTLSGNISGANGLTVSTAGTVVLSGTNSYTTTTMTSGTLQIGSGGATGTLGSGAVTIPAGSNLIFDLSSNYALPAAITAAGNLIQAGAASSTVSLASSGNTISSLAVNSGTFDLNNNSLTLTSFSGSGGGVQQTGIGIITDTSAGAGITSLTYNGTASSDYFGQINDGASKKLALAVGLTAGSTLTLHSASTYSGGTTLNTGVLAVVNTDASGGGLGTGPVVINNTNTGIATELQLGNGTTLNNPITINAAAAGVGFGVLTVTNGGGTSPATSSNTATFGGPITINTAGLPASGGDIVGPGAGGNLIFKGPIILGPTATALVVRAGNVQFADTSGTSSYPAIGITGPGTTSLGATNGIATNAVIEPGLNNAAGVLDLAGFNQTVAGITSPSASTATSTIGTSIGTSTLTVNTSATAFPNTAPDTYTGILDGDTVSANGTGVLQLVKTGPGTLLLTNTSTTAGNDYAGGTLITQGVLGAAALSTAGFAGSVGYSGIDASNFLGLSTSNVIFNGGLFRYTGATAATNQTFVVNNSIVGEFDISTAGTTLTWQGSLTGSNTPTGFIKGGPGTLIIDPAFTNSYSGNTTVNAGTMVVNGAFGAAGQGSTLTLAAGATLSGTGTIAGALNHSAGTIFGGSGTSGTLTFTDPLTLNGGTALYNVTNGTGPLIAANGGLSFGATGETISLQFSGSNPTTPFTLELFSYDNGGAQLSTSNLAYTSNSARDTFTTLLTNNNQVDVVVNPNGGAQLLNWSATSSSVNPNAWDTTSSNWYNSTVGQGKFFSADSVNFGDNNTAAPPGTAQLTTAITIASTVTPTAVTDTANTNNYSFSGAAGIGGATTTLTMSGTSTLTIGNTNTYGGGTTISAGVVNANAASALSSGPIVLNGGQLNINNAAFATGTLTINSGKIDNTSGAAITLTSNNPQSWGGNFTYAGTNALNLGTGAVAVNTSPTVTVNNNTLTVGGVISGGGTITVQGNSTGTLALTAGSPAFSGGVTVNSGNLLVSLLTGAAGSTPLGSGVLTVNSGGTVIGGNADAFGFTAGAFPSQININGGTVTETTGTYRITLPNLNFTGGTLTNGNGADTGVNYSLYGGTGVSETVTTNPASTTAVISGTGIALQNGNQAAASTTFNIAQGTVPAGGPDLLISSPIGTFSGVQGITKQGLGILDLSAANTYAGPTSIVQGTVLLAPTGSIANSAVTVGDGSTTPGGTLSMAANTAAAVLARTFTSLTLTSTGSVLVAPPSALASRTVVITPTLAFAGSTGAWQGSMDLSANDMIVHNASTTAAATELATITDQIKQGYNNGTWTGTGGIKSSTAAAVATAITGGSHQAPTALGVIVNNAGGTATYYSNFDGQAVTATDVLVKYTFVGDANLDGVINGDDYALIDNGYNTHLSGWQNGDFTYAGSVTAADYVLIDNGFNLQGSSTLLGISAGPAEMIATNTDQIAAPSSSSVPEPSTLGVIGIAAVGLLQKRRRRR